MKIKNTQLLGSALKTLLRNRLLLPLIITMLVVMGLAAYYGGQLIETQLSRYNLSVGYSISAYLRYAGQELETIKYIMLNDDGKNTQTTLEAHREAHGFFDTIYILDEKGTVQLLVPDDPRYAGIDFSRREFFLEKECDKGVNISQPFASVRTGQPSVYLTLCAGEDKVIVGELNLGSLQDAISIGQGTFEQSSVYVADQAGTLLAHPNTEFVAQQTNIRDWKIIEKGLETDSIVNYWRDGILWVGSTSKIRPTGWIVVTEVRMLTVYAPYVGSVFALLALFSLVFSVMLQRVMHQIQIQIISPLSKLSEETDALAAGNYSSSNSLSKIPASFLEIERLLTNFQSMSKTILSRETLLKESEEQYRQLVDFLPDAILVHSKNKIVYVNMATVNLYNANSTNDLIGRSVFDLVHPDSHSSAQARLRKLEQLAHADTLRLTEQKHMRLDQSTFDAEVITSSILFGGHHAAQTIVRDITHRKDEEQRLQFQATHDFLTELPNRLLFQDRLDFFLSKAKRTQMSGAVLYLDLDSFKSVNDALGHSSGDFVLKQIAKILKSAIRESDVAARIGGDEFAVLVDDLVEENNAALIANSILKAFSKPIIVQNREFLLSFSIGIALFPQDGQDAQALLQAADAAMYDAKSEGKNRFKFYTTGLRSQSLERFAISSNLFHALERDELFLEYQPQIDSQTGKMIGVEALVRWNHPNLGMISPSRFIPVAEENGLIVPIGEWVLKTACEQGYLWQQIAKNPIQVSVNLAELQLKQPHFVDSIQGALDHSGISPELLELELTENIVFQNANASFEKLFQLKSFGLHLAIDDFGTGYSTLGYLAHFPFDRLKIDQRLAADIMTDSKDAAIVAGIITISNNLGLQVVAEGVETLEQLEFYKKQGCHIFQGWYYSRAVSAQKITEFLENNHQWEIYTLHG